MTSEHSHPDEDAKDDREPEYHSCGYIEDSFACKIRHIHINTGDAKATKDGNRWDRARDLHQDKFNQGL